MAELRRQDKTPAGIPFRHPPSPVSRERERRSLTASPSWGVLSPAASPTAAYGEGGLSACDKTPEKHRRRREGLGPDDPRDLCGGRP